MTITRFLVVSLTALTFFGCDAPDEPGRDLDEAGAADPARGNLGKADQLEGLCAPVQADDDGPACGGPAPVGNCWCDEACIDYGDCCVDAWDTCGVGEPTPAVSQCLSNAQCDDGQSCSGGVCIDDPAPEPVDCDDGTALHPLCDIKPGCPDGQVAAIQNSCFACVDAVTCE